MKVKILTLFPKMFESPFAESMMKRALEKGILELEIFDMKKWAWNNYGSVDDKPFGGGVGMLIRVDVIDRALKEMGVKKGEENKKIVLTSAKGEVFKQEVAEKWSRLDELTIIAGHYEGFDERVLDLVDEEVSLGEFVLTGGELASMVMVDATVRLIKGVLGKDESSQMESYSEIEIEGNKKRLKEYPQYTRPAEYGGKSVPEVLLSGNHKKIEEWKKEMLLKEDK